MFTFKNNKPTGKYRSFEKMTIDVKLKKVVGQISEDIITDQVKIALMVKNSEGNCPFKWIFFKKRFNSFDEAKSWLMTNYVRIVNTYELYFDNE
jgi:hypothetical protein